MDAFGAQGSYTHFLDALEMLSLCEHTFDGIRVTDVLCVRVFCLSAFLVHSLYPAQCSFIDMAWSPRERFDVHFDALLRCLV